MRNTVYDAAIVPCPDYEAEHVRAALTEALDAIGGLDWVKAGMKVGIKPNLAAAKTPEFAVCTHPVMVAELTKMLIERGAQVTIGESPGGIYTAAALNHSYSATGMTLAAEAGAKLNDDFSSKEGHFADAKVLNSFH